jgi:hypothetical protein
VNRKLARRPLDPKRQLPIPFAQMVHDGLADFTTLNPNITLECAKRRLCGLCGKQLGFTIAFIGGPGSAKSRAYSDPPMHVECAEDAFTLCPHLARPLVPRRPSDQAVHQGWVADKPQRWAMLVTRDFTWSLEPVTGGGVAPRFIADEPTTIRWWEYQDGKAQEVS